MNAVNLIPVERRRIGAAGAPSAPFLGLLAGLLIALLATFLYIGARNDVSTRRSELARVQAGVAQWSAAAARYAPDVAAAAGRRAQLTDVEKLIAQRYDWSVLLSQVAGVMPAHAELGSISAVVSSGSPSSAAAIASAGASTTPPGIQVTACAVSQPVVADTMNALRRIAGVSQVDLQSSTDAGPSSCKLPVQFQLSVAFGAAGTGSGAVAGSAGASATTASTTTTSTSTGAGGAQ